MSALIPGKNSEKIREEWRAKALTSTFFMGQVVGHHDFSPNLHMNMSRWIEAEKPGKRMLGLVPRDHLKTSLWTIDDTLRLISGNPLERVLIYNEVYQNAVDILGKIKSVAERCELWRWLFPERIPDTKADRWKQDYVVFPRDVDFPEPTAMALGSGGAATSKHFTRIKFDDFIGKEASESAITMNKAIDQYKLAEHILVDPKRNRIDVAGTRWAPADLYDWILKNEDPKHLDTFILGAYGNDEFGIPLDYSETPIWPERFDTDTLERLRMRNGSYLFAMQMLNKPIADGSTEFARDWLCYYTLTVDAEGRQCALLEQPHGRGNRLVPIEDMNRFQIADPGLSPESKDARSAMLTLGLPPARDNEPYDIVVLSAQAKRLAPEGFMSLVWEEYCRWQPIFCGIEVVAAQQVFYRWLIHRHPDMGLRQLKTDTHTTKLSRIRSSSPFFEQRRVYVHRQMTDFLGEYEAFPLGRTVDLLDCFAYGPQIWSPPTITDELDYDDDDDRYLVGVNDGRSQLTGY